MSDRVDRFIRAIDWKTIDKEVAKLAKQKQVTSKFSTISDSLRLAGRIFNGEDDKMSIDYGLLNFTIIITTPTLILDVDKMQIWKKFITNFDMMSVAVTEDDAVFMEFVIRNVFEVPGFKIP